MTAFDAYFQLFQMAAVVGFGFTTGGGAAVGMIYFAHRVREGWARRRR